MRTSSNSAGVDALKQCTRARDLQGPGPSGPCEISAVYPVVVYPVVVYPGVVYPVVVYQVVVYPVVVYPLTGVGMTEEGEIASYTRSEVDCSH